MSIKNVIKNLILGSVIMMAGTGPATSPGECATSSPDVLGPGDYTQALTSDGLERTFLVHIPPHLEARPALMILFHGGDGTSLNMANISHMNSVADANRFIAVYPQGYKRQWNFGPGSITNVNDVAFVRRMLNYLSGEFNIDQSKIFIGGISEGGHFSERLTYEMPDKIAVASMVCSDGTVGLMQMYGPKHPRLPLVIILGTADPCDPFQGGHTAHLGVDVMSGPATVESWTSSDGCGAPVDSWLPNTCTTDDSRPELKYYYGPGHNDVAFYEIWGGGHAWPGGPVGPKALFGNTNEDFSASQAIWDFCSTHRKRP